MRTPNHWTLLGLLLLGSCRSASPPLGLTLWAGLPGVSDHDGLETTPPADEPPPRGAAVIPLEGESGDETEEPAGLESDWIELTSGEWLRGSFVRLRRGEATFDSENLDEQVIDFGDVRRLVSADSKVVLTEDGRTFEGVVTADEDWIWVAAAKTVQLSRGEVLSVLAIEGDSLSNWAGKVSLGATYRSGNTDQVDYNSLLRLSRETARTRWNNQYVGAVSSVSDQETANNHRLSSTFDIFLTKRAFLTAPGVDVYRDRFQNIALRATPYVALGYQLIDDPGQSWSISLGPAVRYQRTQSELAGEDPSQTTAAAVFSSRYSLDLTSHIDLEFHYDLQAPIPDTNEFNHNLLLSLAVDLPGDLDLDIAFLWDRVNKPRPSVDGATPLPDDFRTTIGVGWSF